MAQHSRSQAADSSTGPVIASGGYTDKAGRSINEDNVTTGLQTSGSASQGGLMAVADGMGGGSAGGSASSLALSVLTDQYFEQTSSNPLENLQRAVAAANQAVCNFAQSGQRERPVGTTLVAAVVVGSQAYIVNVGDSRAYLVRNNQLRQITRDHNWAEQQQAKGLDREQAYADKNALLLTHVLGQFEQLPFALNGQPDAQFSFVEHIRAGDVLVLCSDGLEPVSHTALIRTVTGQRADLAAQSLVEQARHAGTRDNASAVVFQYGLALSGAAGRAARKRNGPLVPVPALIGGGIAVVALVLALLLAAVIGINGGATAEEPTNAPPAPPTPDAAAPPTTGNDANDDELQPATGDATSTPASTEGEDELVTSTPLPATATPLPTNTPLPEPTDAPAPPTPRLGQPTSVPILPPTVPQPPTAVPQPGGPNNPPLVQPTDLPPPTTEPLPTPVPPTAVPQPQLVSVPNVIGLLEEVAYARVSNAGLGVNRQEGGTGCAPFTIVSQNPSGGTQVERGSTVTYTVCPQRTVPNVVGLDKNEARAILQGQGFSVNVETYGDDRYPNGYVGEQSPGPGAGAPANNTVLIRVIDNGPGGGGDGGGGGREGSD